MDGGSMAEPDARAKRWFELQCRHCGQRFIDMAKLLFHACPGRSEARNRGRSHARRPRQARVATTAQGPLRPGENAP